MNSQELWRRRQAAPASLAHRLTGQGSCWGAWRLACQATRGVTVRGPTRRVVSNRLKDGSVRPHTRQIALTGMLKARSTQVPHGRGPASRLTRATGLPVLLPPQQAAHAHLHAYLESPAGMPRLTVHSKLTSGPYVLTDSQDRPTVTIAVGHIATPVFAAPVPQAARALHLADLGMVDMAEAVAWSLTGNPTDRDASRPLNPSGARRWSPNDSRVHA